MSIQFIGFGISKGTFDTDRGEKREYDNRLLRCITNDGLKIGDKGFMAVDEMKVKTEVLATSFNCKIGEVDLYLESALGQECEIQWGVLSGKPCITGLKFKTLDKKS